MIDAASPTVRAILERCLEDRDLDVDDAVILCRATGPDLDALRLAADALRRRQVGDTVAYVINRNVNFTNACVKACHFCAFSRPKKSDEAYFLDAEEIVRRAVEARDLGATEVCIQAGLAPGMDGRLYIDLTRAIKRAAPELHIHAFSPEEVKYGAKLTRMSFAEYIGELIEAGLGSIPGTSAEVLDDEVRARLAPGRITTAEWIEVIRAAHAAGLPTTSTLMFGTVETDRQRMQHLALLRDIQKDTRGFTEFVPLSFVADEAPLTVRQLIPGLSRGPSDDDVARLYAIARLMLGRYIPNLQVSWVKQGIERVTELLAWGANDLGGTLMNESISTSAGADHGQFQSPARLRRAAREAGRIPVQRDTRYRLLKTFSRDPDEDTEQDPLDRVTDAESTFGTYVQLTRSSSFRFRPRVLG